MADLVEVYVNTDVSGGLANGTSLENAYATQWAAEAGSQRAWTTADQYGHIICYATAGTADPTATGWAGHTTDATHYVIVMPGTGQEHSGVWNTSVYRMSVTNTYCVSMQIGFVHFLGIQMESNFSVADYYSVFSLSYVPSGAVNYIGNCIIRTTNGGHLSCMSVSHTNMNVFVYCCIFGPAPYRAIYTNAGNLYSYNNTIVGCDTNGITAGAGSSIFHAINNIVSGSSTDIVSSAATTLIDYNLTTSGAGTHAQAPAGGDWTTVFTNLAGRDFSILQTGTAYHTGIDDPGSGLFSSDSIGNPYTVGGWDMGAQAYYQPYVDGAVTIDAATDLTITGQVVVSGAVTIDAETDLIITAAESLAYTDTIAVTYAGSVSNAVTNSGAATNAVILAGSASAAVEA